MQMSRMSRNQKRYSAASNSQLYYPQFLNALYQTVELTGEKLDMLLIQRLTQLQQALQNVV